MRGSIVCVDFIFFNKSMLNSFLVIFFKKHYSVISKKNLSNFFVFLKKRTRAETRGRNIAKTCQEVEGSSGEIVVKFSQILIKF